MSTFSMVGFSMLRIPYTCTYGLQGSFLVEMDHIRMPNNMAPWCRRFPSKAIVLLTSISPSCRREANLMLFCASEMSSSKTYHSYIILWGAHKPRPFLAKTFRIESSIIVIDSYRAASMHRRHMLPHPFCGSALHSGHCPWHSMACLLGKKHGEKTCKQSHAMHHSIKLNIKLEPNW